MTLEAGACDCLRNQRNHSYLHFLKDASNVMSKSLVRVLYYHIFTMDTQSILKTAIAEHEDSQNNGITLESLAVEAEASLKDLESVRASK